MAVRLVSLISKHSEKRFGGFRFVILISIFVANNAYAQFDFAPGDVQINEVLIDPFFSTPGFTDNGFEFVELRGTPNLSLDGLFLVEIESDGAGGLRGNVNGVADLSGLTLGSNGLLLLRDDAIFTLDDAAGEPQFFPSNLTPTNDSATPVVLETSDTRAMFFPDDPPETRAATFFNGGTAGDLANGSFTLALVEGLVLGDGAADGSDLDLDDDNDGILNDTLPFAQSLDAFGFIDAAGEVEYGDQLNGFSFGEIDEFEDALQTPIFGEPSGFTRLPDGTPAVFSAGSIDVADNGDVDPFTLSTTDALPNPALIALVDGGFALVTPDDGYVLTPGSENFGGMLGDAVENPFDPGDFNGDATIDAADYTVVRDTLGAAITGGVLDVDGNGTVDDGELSAFFTNFVPSADVGGVSSAVAVPEPATLAGLGLLCSLLTRVRRRV